MNESYFSWKFINFAPNLKLFTKYVKFESIKSRSC